LYQGHILRHAVVVVASYVAGVTVLDAVRQVREAIPHALPFAVFIPGALDLVGGGGRAPQEIFWKFSFSHVLSYFLGF
jgi:hypothetical protein